MKYEMQLRFFLLKLKELDTMLDNGDYPDRKGICGYLQSFFNEQELEPKPNLKAMCLALDYLKDWMEDWDYYSGNPDYPVPPYLECDDDVYTESETAFEYNDSAEHWHNTLYAEARRSLVKFLIKQMEYEFA